MRHNPLRRLQPHLLTVLKLQLLLAIAHLSLSACAINELCLPGCIEMIFVIPGV